MQRTAIVFDLAEGPRWFDGRWYFVDILRGRLLTLDAVGHGSLEARRLLEFEHPLGAVAAVTSTESETWIAALGDGIALLRRGGFEWIDRPEAHLKRVRMNDGVCDPMGRFWVGSMGYDARDGAGSLFRVDLDGSVHRVLDGLTIPNGPAFAADGQTMYLADSARGVIRRYQVDPRAGSLGAGKLFATVERGVPDGMVLDEDGDLWVAIWGGSRIDRFRPDGSRVDSLSVDSKQPTSLCFGGADGRELLITTASHGLEMPGPGDGAVWRVRAAVKGPGSYASTIRL